ncbi:cell division protein ZipA C-terminal FtsZ-binding domain-containing protein [Castellaniella sp. S9]|uniref:cell division protein ZipA C-terminal FtsZ-binding domain-containing protein n=1 Tax=Castellaniella sp. S9 TaxID=2993652 RepID=UPI0022B33D01|nr:cell division protein ZipA C-terminal FtsZ-binding domain-containing protein [Castellaniella sp. S9]
MSDLQILLISIGVVLIAAVVLYNWWQDWRVRRSMQSRFPEGERDPLMQDAPSRREPGIWTGEPAAAPAGGDDPAEAEADEACEVVIDIAFGHPVPGEALGGALQSVARVGRKPVRIFAETDAGVHRARLREGEHYVSMQLAVVLANRSGPLTAIEWSHLWTLAQNLAERFEGVIEAPEQDAVLARAQTLDAHCAEMDAQVGLILQLAQARSRQAIAEAATSVGFLPYGERWAWMAENGLPRFLMQFEDGVPDTADQLHHRVDLVLDVPNSVPDDQAFSRMMAVGRDLAARLEASLLDDQGRTLSDSAAPAIDRQISGLYDQLDKAGFLAGTERAARVFS